MKDVTMEQFCNWSKIDDIDGSGDMYLVRNICIEFEKEIWFEFEKIMWKRYLRLFQDQIKYTINDILNPFRVGILK